jgi:hypothetical protein
VTEASVSRMPDLTGRLVAAAAGSAELGNVCEKVCVESAAQPSKMKAPNTLASTP